MGHVQSRRRERFNIALLVLFLTAVGYLIYTAGANAGYVIAFVAAVWVAGLVLAVLRRHS